MLITDPEVLLPLSLISLNFIFKMVIGQKLELFKIVENLTQLPGDLALQSTAFIIAFVVTSPDKIKPGVSLLLLYIIGLAIATVMCKTAHLSLHEEVRWRWYVLGLSSLFGYGISFWLLTYAIGVFTGGSSIGLP